MGCMFRSDKMSFYEMYIQPEQSFHIFNGLGEAGCVQMDDLNPHLIQIQRPHIAELCRYTELDRILRYMRRELRYEGIEPVEVEHEPPALLPSELNSYEAMLEKWEMEILETGTNLNKLQKNLRIMQETQYVLKNVDPILGKSELRRDPILLQNIKAGKQMEGGEPAATVSQDPFLSAGLHIGTGIIRRNRCYAFERMLWRVGRGNIFFRPATRDQLFFSGSRGEIRKVAFVAVCHGQALVETFRTICTAFHARMIDCPKTHDQRRFAVHKLETRITDLTQVVRKSKFHRCRQLRIIARKWDMWNIQVSKSKHIYFHINMLNVDISRKCLIGNCWIPDKDIGIVNNILRAATMNSGSAVGSFISRKETIITPPTYHRTNKFTSGFQNLVNSYGTSVYRELNPGLYTCITFPFLFAIMFGDQGHGLILFFFALWMVVTEKKYIGKRSKNDIWKIFFAGRYIMLLMGISSVFTGFIYNELFSIPIALRESYWKNPLTRNDLNLAGAARIHVDSETNNWYSLGICPVWRMADNKILIENSLKMKMAVIVGVTHMIFGVILSLFNHIYFKQYYAIFTEFLPQLIIITTIFAYLCFLIILKWIKYGAKKRDPSLRGVCAPLLILVFINMFLGGKRKKERPECKPDMYNNQNTVELVLKILAVIQIPILLFGTPIYKKITNKKKLNRAEIDLKIYLTDRGPPKHEGVPDRIEDVLRERVQKYGESFTDIMIHQGVHTIEFVLSTISHTASYLRLWALSLAHSQLSDMLWDMVLIRFSHIPQPRAGPLGVVRVYISFAIWATFSVLILVLMEGLSSFLHTLRLHWVEFMSKFYEGVGKKFSPFNFRELIEGDVKDEKVDCRN